MKVSRETLNRLEDLIARGMTVSTKVGRVGNIDEHDVWFNDARTFLSVTAPEFVARLGSVAGRYTDQIIENPNGRATQCMILEQVEVLRAARDDLEETNDQTSLRLGELYTRSKAPTFGAQYFEELITALYELKLCYDMDCFTAVMALSAKILEICLKDTLSRQSVPFAERDMLGQLIQLFKSTRNIKLPSSDIENVAKIINRHRIGAVHATSASEIPTKDLAIAVIHCTAEVFERTAKDVNG